MSEQLPIGNGVFRRSQALAEGWADHEIRGLSRSGRIRRLGRGAYVDEDTIESADDAGRHRLQIEALAPVLAPDAAFSHQSAAVLYGLPLWSTPLDRVHVTRDRAGRGRTRRAAFVHGSALHGSVAEVDGFRVTDPARTVVDLACTLPFEAAIVAGDAALRHRALEPGHLDLELLRAAGRHGIAAARRAVSAMDGDSESVGESRSRAFFHEQGLPIPLLQGEVRDRKGRLVGRVDFLWDEERVIGEFDGRVKYGRLLRPGQEPGDVVYAEKMREEALRDLGFRVVRWAWADLSRPRILAERIRHALTHPYR